MVHIGSKQQNNTGSKDDFDLISNSYAMLLESMQRQIIGHRIRLTHEWSGRIPICLTTSDFTSQSKHNSKIASSTSSNRFFSEQPTIITPDVLKKYDLSNPECNIPPNIVARVGTNLHLQMNHPLNTIKTKIEEYWQQRTAAINNPSSNSDDFVTRDDLEAVVPIVNNFDSLLIPQDHVSRSKSDTYYVDKEYVLRTHTSAHQTTLMKEGLDRFLVTGDVYR